MECGLFENNQRKTLRKLWNVVSNVTNWTNLRTNATIFNKIGKY